MRYEDARPLIQTGDLIAVRRRSGPFAVATRLVTASPYTHTGVAQWVGVKGSRRLLMAHINSGGASLVPLSQMSVYAFDVFPCPVGRREAERALFHAIGKKIGYSVADLVRIAAHIRLGLPLPAQGADFICSALSAHIYQQAGWAPSNLPSIPWPGAIVAAMDRLPLLECRP